MTDVESVVHRLENWVSELETKIGRLENKIEWHNRDIAELVQRIKKLEENK